MKASLERREFLSHLGGFLTLGTAAAVAKPAFSDISFGPLKSSYSQEAESDVKQLRSQTEQILPLTTEERRAVGQLVSSQKQRTAFNTGLLMGGVGAAVEKAAYDGHSCGLRRILKQGEPTKDEMESDLANRRKFLNAFSRALATGVFLGPLYSTLMGSGNKAKQQIYPDGAKNLEELVDAQQISDQAHMWSTVKAGSITSAARAFVDSVNSTAEEKKTIILAEAIKQAQQELLTNGTTTIDLSNLSGDLQIGFFLPDQVKQKTDATVVNVDYSLNNGNNQNLSLAYFPVAPKTNPGAWIGPGTYRRTINNDIDRSNGLIPLSHCKKITITIP